ncbi:MAG TPA: 16S rRNA (adenine(1518)-N(6)/adenine(1519)-N(6))-dimethyltransferase RsmA [Aggregatilineales bacterium]|nr:16S rRNA (adenine(1518)-N(6)/adenine(1519)-N(6))-dimethyltransferase RsmA [Aggregatilineales bacterium]
MSIWDVLNQLGIQPKKSLGQNFMVEPNALRRMAEAAQVGPDDAVLEIGAGLGALTDVLAEQARRVVAIEVDDRFVPFLRSRYTRLPHVEIVRADILDADPAELMGEDAGQYKVVANVPYYITSAILRHLLESGAPPSLIVMTVQREVAERIIAQPGSMSLLAVSVQYYGKPSLVTRLSAANFYPRPDVESAIVRVEPHKAGPPLPPEEAEPFFRVVRAGFSQPRKQIKNSLAAGLHTDPARATAWLEAAGIDPRRRPETLSLDEWLAIYHQSSGAAL